METPSSLSTVATTNTTQNKSNNKSNNNNNNNNNNQTKSKPPQYNSIVVDTNAIIKGAGLTRLLPSAQTLQSFYTVPGVFDEIVDQKAKHHLESLPFTLISREPSAQAIKVISEFSKKTGDYRELSLVDLHILALTYDLEVLGCHGESNHLRLEPKRKLGGGRVVSLNPDESKEAGGQSKQGEDGVTAKGEGRGIMENGAYEIQVDEASENEEDDDEDYDQEEDGDTESETESDEDEESKHKVNSWAGIVNPQAVSAKKVTFNEEEILSKPFGQMDLSSTPNNQSKTSTTKTSLKDIQQQEMNMGGQFSDAEEDDDLDILPSQQNKNNNEEDDDVEDDYGLNYADSDADMSDEECDIYILDPDEVEARKKGQWKPPTSTSLSSSHTETTKIIQETTATPFQPSSTTSTSVNPTVEKELELDFPSLSAAASVPYEGSDDDEPNTKTNSNAIPNVPPSFSEGPSNNSTKNNNGKKWATFGKDKYLFSSQGVEQTVKGRTRNERKLEWEKEKEKVRFQLLQERNAALAAKKTKNKKKNMNSNASRIMGGMDLAGQSEQVDDDGEGWVTVTNFKSLKANGINGFSFKDPKTNNENPTSNANSKNKGAMGPPPSQRCACATTDFAMQNILLQMGLVLLSIDGMAVRKVKHWVTRCATCFTVYGNAGTQSNGSKSNKNLGGRLFCDKCGGSYLERVSASVDSKTGRYRLYLSKRRRHTKRGTKFSLPKPGKGNRFQGDLLLREDQLMMGAWNQKVKKGNKAMESLFGADIASNVGLGDLTKRSDINVGFGRRNPNSSKFGRERRGKKKKNTDKACGLRRY